jgi:CBS domain-containing protein
MKMEAADVMVSDVITIGPEESVAEAARLMALNDVSALPVIDDDERLVGIISEADLMRREEIGTEVQRPWWIEAMTPATKLAAEFAKSHSKRVEDLMSRDLITATEDTPLSEIAALLERHRIKRIPITRDGDLVGIVSRANLIQALACSPTAPDTELNGSQAIRQELLSRLQHQSWTDFGSRNVIVVDGEVHLWGLVGSEAERKALIAIAEGVPGVTAVVDEMIPAY